MLHLVKYVINIKYRIIVRWVEAFILLKMHHILKVLLINLDKMMIIDIKVNGYFYCV